MVSIAPSPVEISITQSRYSYDSAVSSLYNVVDSYASKAPDDYSIHDFIMMLEICQNLEIDFLPITWQPALDALGVGGQAEVRQSLINTALSFAFSRIKPFIRTEIAERKAYEALGSQLQVLAHPQIRNHENIVTLIGVCWDIRLRDDWEASEAGYRKDIERHTDRDWRYQSSNTRKWTVWPVLVYAKTKHGDLTCFLRSQAGRSLSTTQKLKLCRDIARGIRDMHRARMVHRDVKPQNVLVFEDRPGGYTAKVSDLGYSVRLDDDDRLVEMPLSTLWNAPEWHHRGHRFSNIVKMDMFSLGMVCLWLLFSQECLGEGITFDTAESSLCQRLETLKREDKILSIAVRLAEQTVDLPGFQKQDLINLYLSCLARDPASRQVSFDQDRLSEGPAAYISIEKQYDATSESEQSSITSFQIFSVSRTIRDFYEADYRLREFITSCLEDRFQKCKSYENLDTKETQNIALQLSICSYLGFGIPRDQCQAEEIAKECELPRDRLLFEFDKIRNGVSAVHQSAVADLFRQGHMVTINFGYYYREHNILDEAKSKLKIELSSVVSELGNDIQLAQELKQQLVSICELKADWEEAEGLAKQITESQKRTLGDSHPATLESLERLANIYWEQGRWEDAENIQVSVLEIRKGIYDDTHLVFLDTLEDLAATYFEQERFDEAEVLQLQVMYKKKQMLSDEHRSTLTSMENLATTYWSQEKWEEAQQLSEQVVRTTKHTLGHEHPETLECLGNLAATYSDQGRLDEAENLEISLMETRKRILGNEHPDTLLSMVNIASIYRNQGRLKESEWLKVYVLETRKRVLGEEHVNTIASKVDLGLFYWDQKRFAEAEELDLEVIETYKQTRGMQHPQTLDSMMMLASPYRSQARLEESQQLYMTVLKSYQRDLGEEHLNTRACMLGISKTYYEQRRCDEAEKWALHVTEMSTRAVGEQDMNTITCRTLLARIYKEKGEVDRATRVLKDVISQLTVSLGTEHPNSKDAFALLKEWTQT